METSPSFRELRWARFAEFCAGRERELAERRALLRRVALAASVLPASCVGCALLALVSHGPAAEQLDELLTGVR